jgi:PIN like domain
LRAAHLNVEVHADHFADDAPDSSWLIECGRQDWVVLAKDKNIKRNPLERQALFNAGIAAFFLTNANLTGEASAQAIIKGLTKIANLLTGEKRPFIARILPDGNVELWVNHKGKERLK